METRMSWFDRIFRPARHRRAVTLAQPFPKAWLPAARRGVPRWPLLPKEHRLRLRKAIQIFVAEKEYVGVGPLRLADEIKVAIAAQAGLLIVGRPEFDVYPRLREVIVRPHDFGKVVEAVGPDGRKYRIDEVHSGEAWRRGPVILAWDSVRQSIARPCDGYNVVYHEFAHVLDMQFGITEGSPPLAGKQERQEWTDVFMDEYELFLDENRRGRRTFLDPYGASEPAEFFAVATEHFFEQPREFRTLHKRLYGQMKRLYGQDPARWGMSPAGSPT